MLVNGKDIIMYNAQLLAREIQPTQVTIYDDWLRNAPNPLLLGKQETFKQIIIHLVFNSVIDENALTDISNLMAQLSVCTIKFDDLSFYYDCTIVSSTSSSVVREAEGIFSVDVELKSAYAYKPRLTTTLFNVEGKNINVLGNLPSPAVITITPHDANIFAITIGGFDGGGFNKDGSRHGEITILNLINNAPTIIDGENFTILCSGLNKFKDTEMEDYPILHPGINSIYTNLLNCNIEISYKPKFM